MSPLGRAVLAERAAAVERHLSRVADHLPAAPGDLRPGSDAADIVVFNLWQATQQVIDLAVAACVGGGLGSPTTYADAFRRLAAAGRLETALAQRLARAAGFRNIVVHVYTDLDMSVVHAAATDGPTDLRAFIAALRDQSA